tara:strand:- start:160 stop:876 length:717 start_codon:yes stop_codon:yes gene_type:complete
VLEVDWENKVTLVQTNYLNGTHVENQQGVDSFLNVVFEDGLPNSDDLVSISRGINKGNRSFYSELLTDVMLLLLAVENNKNTESFLLIYRLLEKISVALPLIFSSKEKNFQDVNKFFVSMVPKAGEVFDLKILERFLSQHEQESSSFKMSKVEFDISAPEEGLVKSIISQIELCVAGQVAGMEIDKERSKIIVPYSSVSMFIVNLRNRCFHNQPSRKNFDLSAVGGTEIFFPVLSVKC